MYHLAVLALLGLALFKLVDVLEDVVPGLAKWHGLATLVLAVAGAIALDYNVFEGFKTTFRETWMNTWATGIALAGMTTVWRAAFHFLGDKEGDAPQERHISRLHRAA